MCVSPPSVNQMVKTLEKRGLILRQPGVPRSIRLLVPKDEIPPLRGGDGKTELAGTVWLLPYWMGRYYGLVHA